MPVIHKCIQCGNVPVVSFDQCKRCESWFCPDCGPECDHKTEDALASAKKVARFIPMTQDRGRSWGVWDNERQTWQIVSYRFHSEEEAQEKADYLNGQTD